MHIFKKEKKGNGERVIYFLGHKIYHKKKRKNEINANLKYNKIQLPELGVYKINVHGKNNEIIIQNGHPKSNVNFSIYGDNNKVFIDTERVIKIGCSIGYEDGFTTGCLFQIGKNTAINEMLCNLLDKNSKIIIGNDCLFSVQIEMWASDTHSLFDEDKNLINRGEEIIIGNHVWIGKGVKILKNSHIPDGCVVGMGSVISKKFVKPNTVLAGIPAKVVKENISWLEDRPNEYIK